MLATLFGCATLLTILVVSARSYDHRDRHYATGKSGRIDAPPGFAWVYRFVQGSTAIFGLLAFLVESPFLQLHRNPAGILIGCATALLGLGIFRSAKTTLGRHYSPCFDSFLPRDVQLDGIYRRVRHPIYTGNIVILLGLTLATGSPALAINLFLVTVYYSLSARREEAALAERFPEYREYVGRSGRFVPFALPDD